MGYYNEIYLKRLNEYGDNAQDRIVGEREANFEKELARSLYKTQFSLGLTNYDCVLSPFSQDKTKTLKHLLTRKAVVIAAGTILEIPINSGVWYLIYWAEDSAERGYNRYVALRLSHQISYTAADSSVHTTRGYLYGPGSSLIFDSLKSKSLQPIYYEHDDGFMFITTYDDSVARDIYTEVTTGTSVQGFVITGYDIISTGGVEFITLRPTYIHDLTTAPQREGEDTDSEWFWLEKGGN